MLSPGCVGGVCCAHVFSLCFCPCIYPEAAECVVGVGVVPVGAGVVPVGPVVLGRGVLTSKHLKQRARSTA